MDNQIQLFTSDEFGNIRVTELNGKPAFVANDAAKALELQNIRQNLANLDDDEKGVCTIYTPGGPQKMLVVTEAGLYELVFQSRKPTAKAFKRWIKHEVLPKIREHGVYMTAAAAERILNDPDFIIRLAQQVKDARNKIAALEETVAVQNQQIAELQPKGAFYDTLLSIKGAWAVGVIAKDYGMKAPAFNQLLHDLGLQYQQGAVGKKYWLLTQKALDLQGDGERWTVTETKTFQNANGEQCLGKPFMRWTQNGRIALYYLLKEKGILPKSERPHTDD